jgi:intein-encoded DNA endonuclease-like protein
MISKEFLVERYYGEEKSIHDIAKELGVTYPVVRYWMKKLGVPWRDRNYAITLKNGHKFDESKRATLSYILGVLLGDGYVYSGSRYDVRLNVAERDKNFALSFKKALEDIDLHPLEFVIKPPRPKYSPQICVVASSYFFVKWYRNLMMDDIKTLVMENEETMVNFIKGFYESEGSIWEIGKDKWKGLQIDISNTKKEVILL